MKFGVSSYSFSRLYNETFTQLDAIVKAKEIGFDVIEFAGLDIPKGMDITIEEYAKLIADKCKEVGIEVGNYTIGAELINNATKSVDDEIERLKGEVDIAAILGAPGMRHDGTNGIGIKGFDNALPSLIKGYRAVTEYAQTKGIKTMIENHGHFCQDSERVERLVSGVNHDNFGLLIDMGNFLCADEAPEKAIGRLAPYAFHLHAKDFIVKSGNEPHPGAGFFASRSGNFLRGTVVGQGNVPVVQVLRVMKNAGYEGTISIEFEGVEDVIWAITTGLENLKNYYSMI